MSKKQKNKKKKQKVNSFVHRLFIDGLSGMSLGLFSTLIIGLIIAQIAKIFPQEGLIYSYLNITSRILTVLMGPAIGCAVAHCIGAPKLAVYSSIFTGLAGAYSTKIIDGAKHISDAMISTSGILLSGPGDPLSSFVATVIAAECGRLIYKKTKIDILLVPFVTIISGLLVAITLGPALSKFATTLGGFINYAAELQPFWMGIIISVAMGMLLTLPVSSAAIAIMLGLGGIAGGAATAGCSAQMIGFAIISFSDNGFNGLISQGLGTSMLQIPNIIKNPKIWLPVIITSAITGPIASCILKMKTLPEGSGMGTSGLVGQIMTYSAMQPYDNSLSIILKIIAIDFLLPALICYIIYAFMKKKGWIKPGDMKLED